MSVKSASSPILKLNHLYLLPKNTHLKQQETAITITNKILTHLNANRLQKAVSVLFLSSFPLPVPLYARLFGLCSSVSAIVEARKVESHLVTHNPDPPVFLLNRAIECYAKCGFLNDARELFDEMPKRDGGSWNAMITAYSQGGCAEEALGVFQEMDQMGVCGNEVTFASVLGSCGAVRGLFLAKQVHGRILKVGFCGNVILGTSLVDVYGKCRVMRDSRRMFDEIENPNDVTWNVIVRRYLEMGDEEEAIVMFFKCVGSNITPLNYTFLNALNACSRIPALKVGNRIHGVSIKVGLEEDDVVSSSLIDMYLKCGQLESAHRIFDNIIFKNIFAWTSIVSGYAMSGRTAKAIELFNEMPEKSVISWNAMLAGYTRSYQWDDALDFVNLMRNKTQSIDHVTLGLILNVCTGLSDVEMGKQVHGFIYRHGFFSSLFVGNALLDMYGKCGTLKSARVWFGQMSSYRDKVSWNALLTSYACHGLSEEAMAIFWEMQWEAKPSKFTFSSLLAACANIFALDQGKQIHGYMIRNEYEIDMVVSGALVDMYCKCRYLGYAFKVFKEANTRDLIIWNSMILGCCHHNRGREALELFTIMEEDKIKPDHVTFHGILIACLCEGLAELGGQYFDLMSEKYCIIPRLEHYECMIELYSRHGAIDKLEDFMKKMPFDPTIPMLTRVFDACREHEHSRLGEWAAQRLNDTNPSVPYSFVIIDKNMNC